MWVRVRGDVSVVGVVGAVDGIGAGGISGRMRCGSGLLRVVRGRRRGMMRLWI